MTDNARSRAWFRIAVVYFAVAVTLGIMMGGSHDHTLTPVHAHLNLLGWVTMTLFALISMAHPAITKGPLATAQFWLHNIGVPVMLGALALRLKGYAEVEPVIGLASVAVGVSVGLFAWLVLTRLRAASR
jgi:nitric oxide reductase large subunit